MAVAKNTICLWYEKDAEEAARFYASLFPDSVVKAVFRAPGDYPSGKQGDVLTVDFTVCGVPCIGLNGGPMFTHSEAFSFQIATDDQEETDRYWNAIVGNGGQESECGWCKDKWGISWQITPRTLTEAMAAGGAEAKRAFEAMMKMQKIDVARIDAAGGGEPRMKNPPDRSGGFFVTWAAPWIGAAEAWLSCRTSSARRRGCRRAKRRSRSSRTGRPLPSPRRSPAP